MGISKIKEKLEQMGNEDQDIRKRFITDREKGLPTEELKEKMSAIDKENTKALKAIVDKIGLPTISKVGEKAYKGAWLIAQHSPDHDFQKKYLSMMKENIDDVRKQDIAFLTDRVLIKEGKPQIYGTQYKLNKETDEYELYEVVDEENLEKRQKEMDID